MQFLGAELSGLAILAATAVGSLAQVSQVVVAVRRNRRDEVNSGLKPLRDGRFDPMLKRVLNLDFETWFTDNNLRSEVCAFLAIWSEVSETYCSPQLYSEVLGPNRMAECRALLERAKLLVVIGRSCDSNFAGRLGAPFNGVNRSHVLKKLYSRLKIN